MPHWLRHSDVTNQSTELPSQPGVYIYIYMYVLIYFIVILFFRFILFIYENNFIERKTNLIKLKKKIKINNIKLL